MRAVASCALLDLYIITFFCVQLDATFVTEAIPWKMRKRRLDFGLNLPRFWIGSLIHMTGSMSKNEL